MNTETIQPKKIGLSAAMAIDMYCHKNNNSSCDITYPPIITQFRHFIERCADDIAAGHTDCDTIQAVSSAATKLTDDLPQTFHDICDHLHHVSEDLARMVWRSPKHYEHEQIVSFALAIDEALNTYKETKLKTFG